jgi:outer membrane PBP1 activator LpoA protein
VHTAEGAVVGQFDLAGIVFVDMPWMVAPDHPAVMAYPRLTGVFATYEQERFYAIGIDAWRLSQMMLESAYSGLGILDGVTGQLVPGTSRQFQREPLAAEFTQAGVRALGTSDTQ